MSPTAVAAEGVTATLLKIQELQSELLDKKAKQEWIDRCAWHALQGILARVYQSPELATKDAYAYAEGMWAERERRLEARV